MRGGAQAAVGARPGHGARLCQATRRPSERLLLGAAGVRAERRRAALPAGFCVESNFPERRPFLCEEEAGSRRAEPRRARGGRLHRMAPLVVLLLLPSPSSFSCSLRAP